MGDFARKNLGRIAMEKKKIVFTNISLKMGGTSRVNTDIANELAKQGHRVDIILLFSEPKQPIFFQLDARIKIYHIDSSYKSSCKLMRVYSIFAIIFKLRTLLVKLKPDLIISFGEISNCISLLANLLGGKHKIVVRFDMYPPKCPLNKFWDLLRKITYPLATKVISLNASIDEWYCSNIQSNNNAIIPNPVSFPLENSTPFITPVPFLKKQIVLAAGQLMPVKAFHKLIQAFHCICDKEPGWELVILGDGPEKENLQNLCARLQLNDKVHLLGACGNLADWYGLAKIFVLTSEAEAHGCVLTEAMAHGTAVIAFDCPVGPRNIITHEVDGILVENGNVSELAKEMLRLIRDENKRNFLARNGLQVIDKYNVAKIARQHLDCLERRPDRAISQNP